MLAQDLRLLVPDQPSGALPPEGDAAVRVRLGDRVGVAFRKIIAAVDGVTIAEAITYFEQSDLAFALVTKSTGELMGAIRKTDLDNAQKKKS